MLIPNKHSGYFNGLRRLHLDDGGDEGGGGGASPATQTQYINQIPRFAPEIAPYAQTLLGQAAALTDTDMNPYMQYQGERNAQFSPLQNQSYENMALMRSQPQLQDATALAGQAGLGALNTQYTFDPSNFNKAFSAANIKDAQGNVTGNTMMNPYMDNVVARQQQNAQRQADIARQSQQAQATRAGAFGGSGDYLMRGQAAGDLARQKGDIQAQGLNNAYNQAMQQYNTQNQQNAQQQQYGAGLGLQGLQMANQSAQNLGTLGGLQYQQNMGINQMQNQYGLQQQAQVQQDLTNKYQDYLNAQNYPYKQLGFMSDMVRGLPLGQQSTQSMYPQAPGPSTVQTLAGLGGAAYGFGKSGMFGKEGGLMTSYAEGGVTSDQNVEGILSKLSDQQLAQAKKTALARRDVEQANMIDAEMAERASIRGGLGGAFNQIPEEQQEQMMYGAGGGIVAFAGGGTSKKRFEESLDTFMKMQQPASQTPEEFERGAMSRMPMLQRMMGPDVTEPFAQELKAEREKLPEQMEKDKGLAIAAASLRLLTREPKRGETKKQQFVSGLGEAGLTFAGEVGRLKKENREADNKIRQSQLLIATAQQQRKEGLAGKAIASQEKAEDRIQDAYKQKVEVQAKSAQLLGIAYGNELQADTSRYATDTSAKVQREAMNKTGELERIMADVEAIRSGKKSFAGKTGEAGAQAYQDTLAKVGEARGGYRYLGPDKSISDAAAITNQAMEDGAVKALEYPLLAAQASKDPVKIKAAQDAYNTALRAAEQRIRDNAERARAQKRTDAGAPGKSVADVGRTPDPEAVNILKSAPSTRNRKYFDDVYGAGAAARVLGN